MGWYADYVLVFYPQLTRNQIQIVKDWITDFIMSGETPSPQQLEISNVLGKTQIKVNNVKNGDPISFIKGNIFELLLNRDMPENSTGSIEWIHENYNVKDQEEEPEFLDYNRATEQIKKRISRLRKNGYEKIGFNGPELIISETPVQIGGQLYIVENSEHLVPPE